MYNKNQDLEKIAIMLDITPTMYKYAVDRYIGMAKFLTGKGIEADIYPQGSFRTGTVVRPMKDGQERDYDIDLVCELKFKQESTKPGFVKNVIGDALKSDGEYSMKLRPEEDRCWTLDYADVANGVGLSMDVVPCVHETIGGVLVLKSQGIADQYAEEAIEITERVAQEEYDWQASNPGGYGLWFDDINRRFFQQNFQERKIKFFNENRSLFSPVAMVEDVPDALVKSSLQRTIQLLKRHRDVFYHNARKWNERPISAIIVTLAAQLAQHSPYYALDDLLRYIANGMADYAELLQGRRPRNETYATPKLYIRKEQQKWVIRNPVNPNDNYADSWTDETAELFFRWIRAVEDDLGSTSPIEERKYITGLQRGLGLAIVEKAIRATNIPSVIMSQTPSKPITPTRPWGGA